jgi:hypothetical protein
MRPPVNERKEKKNELQRSFNVGGSCYHVVQFFRFPIALQQIDKGRREI